MLELHYPMIQFLINIYIHNSTIELDICRIHVEEYHKPVFYTFNRFIRYAVIFSVHTWNTEDSEGEGQKNLVTFSALSW